MIENMTIELSWDAEASVWHACIRLTDDAQDFAAVGSHPAPDEAVSIALADLENNNMLAG